MASMCDGKTRAERWASKAAPFKEPRKKPPKGKQRTRGRETGTGNTVVPKRRVQHLHPREGRMESRPL